MNDLYMRLTYEQYKGLESQLRRWSEIETTHRTVEGGYHKALRLHITDSLIIEFMGPLVKAPLEEIVPATAKQFNEKIGEEQWR